MIRLFIPMIALLAGCTTNYPGSPQACAGINDASISYNAQTGQVDAKLCGGKENDHIKLTGKTPNGLEFEYEAKGAKGFEGQAEQAAANAVIMENLTETLRNMVPAK